MKKIILTILCAGWLTTGLHSQAVQNIPAELMENAFSVVQNSETEVVCESIKNGLYKKTYTVTILHENGKDDGHFHVFCDKFNSLTKFSGEVFDRNGKIIRKLKKSDLKMSEYSNGLSTDDYVYYYECSAPYPYTVKYSWEIKQKDGIIAYPIFYPQSGFNQSVVKASYRLTVPAGAEARYRLFNTTTEPTVTKAPNGATTYEMTLNNLPAQESEVYGPSIRALAPYVYFNPTDFFFDGTQGTLRSWEEYGQWSYKLQEGRDVLPPAFEAKVKEMTAGCSSDREKVKVLYDYLANTTRYVSIQLGIGGLQPISATNVNKTGFGDCKALSNYMKAMLKVVGIPSNYAEISTTNARILKDYVSLNQTNHVVLQVPLTGDTLWLECTNAMIPFGYIHEDIAGHDAVLITEKGGQLTTLPAYPDSLNTQTTVARVLMDPTGKATITACQTSYLSQYENTVGIAKIEPNKQKDRLRNQIQLTQANITNVVLAEKKETTPSIAIDYTVETTKYGNKTGNRLFIPVNIFRDSLRKLPKKERKHHIYIKYGYLDTDSINIAIPDGYTIESLPKPFAISGAFGKFETSYQHEGNEIQVVHKLFRKSGKFDKDDYVLFSVFNNLVSEHYNSKIILRKE